MENYFENPELLLKTLIELFQDSNQIPEKDILSDAILNLEETGYDNWNGGTNVFGVFLTVPVKIFAKYEGLIEEIEKSILDKVTFLFRPYEGVWIGSVIISPSVNQNVKSPEKTYSINNDELVKELESMRNIMISVSTGGARIQTVNSNYISKYEIVETGLSERQIQNPNPYRNLWDWYGKWSSGDLPSYQSRRQYISELLLPVINSIKEGKSKSKDIFSAPTGWTKVDRTIGEIRKRLADAQTEEQFQAVGLLSREALISLGQLVFDSTKHETIDGTEASKTDAKRMLEAYLNAELSGSTNEVSRKFAKSALSLANDLTHRRTATFKNAALCAESVSSVINIIAIISGQRNP